MSADGSQGFDISQSDGRRYIGQYIDSVKEDSTDYTKYNWSLRDNYEGFMGSYIRFSNDGGQTFTAATAYTESGNYGNGRNLILKTYSPVTYTPNNNFNYIKVVYDYSQVLFKIPENAIMRVTCDITLSGCVFGDNNCLFSLQMVT